MFDIKQDKSEINEINVKRAKNLLKEAENNLLINRIKAKKWLSKIDCIRELIIRTRIKKNELSKKLIDYMRCLS